MVTPIKSQITPAGAGAPDPGYDYRYVSLNLWEAARAGNLTTRNTIEIAEVFSGGNALTGALLIYATWTTDATRYIEIRAAAGHEHTGVWSTSKAYLSSSGNALTVGSGIGTDIKYCYIKKLQIESTNAFGLNIVTAALCNVDRCIIKGATNAVNTSGAGNTLITNSIIIATNTTGQITGVWTQTSTVATLYNCTVISVASSGQKYGVLVTGGTTINSQNTYIAVGNGAAYANGGGTFNKGANDATSNAEALTANLDSIAYSTANFTNVTAGSENLRLTVSASNKLINNGANLSGSGVTTDIVGVSRPQAGAFDIGAFENDIPICWNYTARYKNSSKLFKASGCGSFPKNLRVPSNVDTSTGKMVDDGILINPDKYSIC